MGASNARMDLMTDSSVNPIKRKKLDDEKEEEKCEEVPNEYTLSGRELKQRTLELSGAFTPLFSIRSMVRTRELGRRERPRIHCPLTERNSSRTTTKGGFTIGEKTLLINRCMPNRRVNVDRVNTKTFCCLYMPGGRIITGSQDEKIRFYLKQRRRRIGQRARLRSFRVPEVGWSILDLALNSTANRVAYSTWSDCIYFATFDGWAENLRWNTLYVPDAEATSSTSLAYFSIRYTMDDQYLIGGASDGCVHMFNNTEEPHLQTFEAHQEDVNAIHCSKSSPHIFCSGGDDGLCKVWDIRLVGANTVPVGVFAGHRDGIIYIDGRADEKYILTNSKDQTIKVWDLRRFSSKNAEKLTVDSVRNQTWDYRYHRVPPIFQRLGPLEEDGSIITLRGHSVQHTLIRAKFSPERTGLRYVYCGSAEGNVYIYDIVSGDIVRILSGHRSVVRDCCWDPEDNEIICSSWDGETTRWYYDGRREQAPYGSRLVDDAQIAEDGSIIEDELAALVRPSRLRRDMD